MKAAIVHDWLVNYGGGEAVVEAMLRMYPGADIFTLVCDRKKMRGRFEGSRIFTSSLQKIPFATKIYTKLLAFMPKAFESFDFSSYDLVISSSSCCAKGVIVPPLVPHVAYIHSPMRYAWDLFFDYKKRSGALTRFFMDRWMPKLREWDFISSQRPDVIVANSKYIARRIKRFWARDSVVVNPPVRLAAPSKEKVPRENFYVAFSRLVQYKRIDLAVAAAKETGRALVVIGAGPEEKKLRVLARGSSNITFLGRASDEVLADNLRRCRAMVFCAEEDFGIAPVEAQALGAPVIAFGRGGAAETVVDGKTGVFFEEQTVESLEGAMERFEALDESGAFVEREISARAKNFSEERFAREFALAVEAARKTAGGN